MSNGSPPHADGVRPPRRARPVDLSRVLKEGLALANGPDVDGEAWGTAPYHPTPTIIEAARALYSRHSVEAITRNDAGAKNLSVTSAAVEEIIERARAHGEKAIVFVTGVPGAGKDSRRPQCRNPPARLRRSSRGVSLGERSLGRGPAGGADSGRNESPGHWRAERGCPAAR